MKQLLKHFTVRVGEDMKVLTKPHDVHITSLQGSQDHGKLWNAYNNALELVQMPRVMGLDKYLKEAINNDCHDELWNVYNYMDFAKPAPKLYQYIACDQNGKPMEKPTKPENLKFSVHIENMYNEACEAYETALSKTLFYGWEYDCTQLNNVFLKQGNVIMRFDANDVCSISKNSKTQEVVKTLEDAFIAYPHFVKLEKLT